MPSVRSWPPLTAARASLWSRALAVLAPPPLAPARHSPALPNPNNALLLFDLAEKVLSYDSSNDDLTGETPTLDDIAKVAYELVSPDGKVIGSTKGFGQMAYQRPDGGFVGYFSEEIRLADGNVIRTGGLVDDTRLTAGEQATIPAVGVAGPFKGAVGFRQFRPVVAHKEYQSAIVLYRR